MAEYIANASQSVATGGNVLFTDTVVGGNCYMMHRTGSGLISIKGTAGECRSRYKIFFSGNIAIPSTGTATNPISLAIAINGEPVSSSSMIETPGVASQFNNVATTICVEVPSCCCTNISVQNTSGQTITVQNANIVIEPI
jgi:hypothetical protein